MSPPEQVTAWLSRAAAEASNTNEPHAQCSSFQMVIFMFPTKGADFSELLGAFRC